MSMRVANNGSYSRIEKIPLDKLSKTDHLIVKQVQSEGHLEYEQKRQQLIKTLQSNVQLHFDNPNFRQIDPITYKNQPAPEKYVPIQKLSSQSYVDHLAGYPEPEQKKQLASGSFSHLSLVSPQKQWKSSSKRIDFKPVEAKVEKNQVKMTTYTEKYKRNPILEGETVAVKSPANKDNIRFSAGDQTISSMAQTMNDRKFGFNGERKKRSVVTEVEKQHFNKTHNNIFSPSKNQQNKINFFGSEEVKIGTQLDRNVRENKAQTSKNVDIFKSEAVNVGTKLDPTLKEAATKQKNVQIYENTNWEKNAAEMWPLRSDFPSKKPVENSYTKYNNQQKIGVFHAMNYDYGMPNKVNFVKITDKHEHDKAAKANYQSGNQGDYRRKYNVLEKEEKLATANATQYQQNLKLY